MIFFVMTDLSALCPMYQYSLDYFVAICHQCITDPALNTEALEDRYTYDR